jgi:HD-GYP domain-containing protein (c-di-GMP phosphodiesterase class II)
MSDYLKARKSQYHFYRSIPLYTKAEENKYVLYKPPGITLGEMRLNKGLHPEPLYISEKDKLSGIQEAQKAFNRKLESDIQTGSPKRIKETLRVIMEETLTEPRSGSLEGVSETMEILTEYTAESDVIKNLLAVSTVDYSTILHSINVMTFALGFGISLNYSKSELKTLGLSALLHDVGKTKVDPEILTAPRKLTREEFEKIQSHSLMGYNILKACKFSSKEIRISALEHHEKLDKSGYPNGKSRISEISQIIGIIDCYEALTNDDRPYRSAMPPYDALRVIKEDVVAGKFRKDIFEKLTYSLAGENGVSATKKKARV